MTAPASPGAFEQLRAEPGTPAATGTFVAVLEVVRFAQLRRSIGYPTANALMHVLAERLTATVPGAEIGRVGRTTVEFAFTAAGQEAAARLLEAAVAAAHQPILLAGARFEVQVLIGAVDAGGQAIGDALVDAAAGALAEARARHVAVAFAEAAAADQACAQDMRLIRHLRRAAERGELQLLYQPKFHTRENRFTSAEALLRWHHPHFGTVPTDRFIGLAEETGEIRELTEWVLARTVADQAALVAAGHRLELYVNLSGQLVQDSGFIARALAAVTGSAAPIGFEITETAVIADPETALANLHALRAAGIRIAIDDYGSGLSSLAYLKQLPAQELKIDRMFVSGLVNSHRDPLLVRSSIDLAHALEMEVTAEGVDDAVACSLLRVMGCDLLQGFLISPPIALPELIAFLGDAGSTAALTRAHPGAPWTGTKRARAAKEG